MAEDLAAEREARLRDVWGKWNEGVRDPDAMGEITDDFALDSALTGRTFQGRQGIADWMAEIDGSFEAWELRIDSLRATGPDRFLILGGVHLKGRGSGVEFDQPIGWVVDFDGDAVTRLSNFADHDEAVAAAQEE